MGVCLLHTVDEVHGITKTAHAMGQVETSIIKAFNDANTQPLDVALNKLWKKLDKKPCCGVLEKKDAIKFLNCVCELIDKERKNWPSDVPTLEAGAPEKWYKILDPNNQKVVAWEEVLRAAGFAEVTCYNS